MSSNYHEIPEHHVKQEYCETRPKYRRGKKKTAIRVFTVNAESKYLVVSGIPSTGLEKDLVKLFASFGTILQCKEMTNYPKEDFTQVFLIVFENIQPAKTAKKNLDERYFFGAMLHVCYAPEYETVKETREKILHRRHSVIARVKYLAKEERNKKLIAGKRKCPKVLENPSPKAKNCSAVYSSDVTRTSTVADSMKIVVQQVNLNVESSNKAISGNSKPPPSFLSAVKNNIPFNQFGIPLFLPPPPPTRFQVPHYPSQQNLYDNIAHSRETQSCSVIQPLSDLITKKDTEKSKNQPLTKSKHGNFYEKVLYTMKSNDYKSLNSSKGNVSSAASCSSHVQSKIIGPVRPITVPLFLPRKIELKHLDEINKVDTDSHGNVLMFGSHIYNSDKANL